jgi:serine O-acetyltransferase
MVSDDIRALQSALQTHDTLSRLDGRIGSLGELLLYIRCDMQRHFGRCGWMEVVKAACIGTGAKFTISLRIGTYLKTRGRLARPLYVLAWLIHRRCMIRFGCDIPLGAKIGPGLYIGHFGAVVVSGHASVGANCNLSHDVTIGMSPRGPRAGYPVIGDRVYLAPGSRVIGAVKVGDGAAIGANAVVTKDVPPNAVVVGIPARVISESGSADYIQHPTDKLFAMSTRTDD